MAEHRFYDAILAGRRFARRARRAERDASFVQSERALFASAIRGLCFSAALLIVALLAADVTILAPGLSAAGVLCTAVAATLVAVGWLSPRLPTRWLDKTFFTAATLAVAAVVLLQAEESPSQVFGFQLMAMAPVAAAAAARWSLRAHSTWLALMTLSLAVLGLVDLKLRSGVPFAQFLVSFSIGSIVSLVVLLFLRLERYRSYLLLRRVSLLSERAARARVALLASLDELRQSRLTIRKLEGILPTCASCGLVRTDDDSEWLPLAEYLVRRGAVSLSHGLCPTCYERTMSALPSEDEAV